MIKKLLIAVPAILVALTLFAAPAFASHKPGHQYPPGCTRGNPPPQSHKCWKHGFSDPPASKASLRNLRLILDSEVAEQASGITVGMVMLVAAGTLTVVLTIQHRRRLQALRR